MLWPVIPIASFVLGLSITSRLSKRHSLATAFPLGLFVFAWLCFIISLGAGFSEFSILLSALLCFAAFAISRPELNPGELDRWDIALLSLSIAIFFVFYNQSLLVFNERGSAYTSSRDFEYHASIISHFSSSPGISLIYPFFPSQPLNYYFLADFASAAFVKLGAGLLGSISIMDTLLSAFLSLCTYRLGLVLTRNRAAALLAAALIIFNSNLGFLDFYGFYSSASQGEQEALSSDPLAFPFSYGFDRGIAIGPNFIEYFLNQRPFLAGLSVGIPMLIFLFEAPADKRRFLLLGILAGMLPLYHLHTFAFVMLVFLVFSLFNRGNPLPYALFGLTALVLAAPQLALLSSSAAGFRLEPAWVLNYDSREWDVRTGEGAFGFIEFWARNAPILIVGIAGLGFSDKRLRALALISLVLFILMNTVVLHPYKQDNRKISFFAIMLMAFPCSLLLARLLSHKRHWPMALLLFLLLVGGAVLEYASMLSGNRSYLIYPGDDIALCEVAASQTAPDALFLDSGIGCISSLAGRRTFIRLDNAGRYWLNSRGINYTKEEAQYSDMLRGNMSLVARSNITNILLGTSWRGYVVEKETLAAACKVLWTDGNSYLLEVNSTD